MGFVFTDRDKVKKNAGFDDNDNITNEEVDIKVASAESEIISALAVAYDLSFLDDANFTGSIAEDFLVNLATEYGSAKLLYAQYKGVDINYAEEAGRRIVAVKSEMKMLRKGTMRLVMNYNSILGKKETSLIGIIGEFPKKIMTKDMIF